MRTDEWDTWRAASLAEYAEEMVRNKGMAPEEASERAERQTHDLLADGLATPGHHLFVVEDVASGERVGHLWFGPRTPDADPQVAWLYDISVEEVSRGRGIGRRIMELLEDEARSAGMKRIELNVFGDNEPAKRLYASTGFVEMARQMGKDLDPSLTD